MRYLKSAVEISRMIGIEIKGQHQSNSSWWLFLVQGLNIEG